MPRRLQLLEGTVQLAGGHQGNRKRQPFHISNCPLLFPFPFLPLPPAARRVWRQHPGGLCLQERGGHRAGSQRRPGPARRDHQPCVCHSGAGHEGWVAAALRCQSTMHASLALHRRRLCSVAQSNLRPSLSFLLNAILSPRLNAPCNFVFVCSKTSTRW